MPTMPDWRDTSGYHYLAALDSASWAWEFLRRNSDYRVDFTRCRRALAKGAADTAKLEAEASRRWRLRCPARPRPRRQASDRGLAARTGFGGVVPGSTRRLSAGGHGR